MLFRFLILTHNRPASVLALVGNIRRLEKPPAARLEIIIWDNGSKARAQEQVYRAVGSDPEVHYIRATTNTFMQGKWHLENRAFHNWNGECDSFLVHLDDDVQLADEWLVHAWKAVERYGWIACGSVVAAGGRFRLSGQRELRISIEKLSGGAVSVWDWEPHFADQEGASQVRFAGHRALLVRMTPVTSRHDPHLLIGGEDLDYSLTLQRNGGIIGIDSKCRTIHRAFREGEVPGFRTRERVAESWRHFYGKWGFVRRSACLEAGMTEQEWLNLFSGMPTTESHAAGNRGEDPF